MARPTAVVEKARRTAGERGRLTEVVKKAGPKAVEVRARSMEVEERA